MKHRIIFTLTAIVLLVSGISGIQTVQAETQKNPVTKTTYFSDGKGYPWVKGSVSQYTYDADGRVSKEQVYYDYDDGEGRLTYSDETNYKYNAQGKIKSKEKTHVSYVYRYENGQTITDKVYQSDLYKYAYDENGHKIKENKYNEKDNTILQRKQWQYEGNRLISVITKSYDTNGTVQEYEKQSYSNGKLAEDYTKDYVSGAKYRTVYKREQKDTNRVKTAYVYEKENGQSAWNKTCAIKSIYADGRLLSEIRYDAKSGKWCRSSKEDYFYNTKGNVDKLRYIQYYKINSSKTEQTTEWTKYSYKYNEDGDLIEKTEKSKDGCVKEKIQYE